MVSYSRSPVHRESLSHLFKRRPLQSPRLLWLQTFAPFLLIACALATTSWLALVPTTKLAHAATQMPTRATLPAKSALALVQGPGFDTCDVPSSSALASWWGTSPYRWIGAYLGGEAIGGCSLTNLSASWVGSVIGQGWELLPIWSGLQSPCATASNIIHRMSSNASTSYAQGVSDADQAISVATGLGLSAGPPIFFDMEQYSGDNTCISATNAFINGWDQELAAHGYLSGLYESSSNIPSVLSGEITEPTEVWMAGGGNVWSGSYNASCSVFGNSYVADSAWANHQRAYQYTAGHNETYNGTTLNIDSDCGDFTLAGNSAQGTRGASQAVSQPNGTVDTFFKGTNGSLYHVWYTSSGSWVTAAMSGTAPLGSEPSAVTSSPGVVDVFWKGADSTAQLWHIFYLPGSGWTSAAQSLGDGPLNGRPEAIAQSDGSIQVFWRGMDNNIWHTWFTPGSGWAGAQQITTTGNVVSDPAPVNTKLGTWDVFWEGSDSNLWHVYQNPGDPGWTTRNLGDGPLGGPPRAIGQSDGAIQVVWRGTNNNIWHAWFTPGSGWAGPQQITSTGNIVSDPTPVNTKLGTWDVFWMDDSGAPALWHVYQNPGDSSWTTRELGYAPLGGSPVATGQPNGTIDVFWAGTNSAIWHAWYNPGGSWAGPQSLGGSVD